jgi:ABC-type transport system involved in multi-copper enzyme maturation permease subunit
VIRTALIQTLALFVDAYRELNARKLFWIALGLSVIGVGAYAGVGIDDAGLSIFGWHVDSPYFNLRIFPSREFFYSFLFVTLGIKVWLTWVATILALVSTAAIIPDFVASGAIDVALAKPISRLRLFFTKWLTGLLFVLLQVALFTLAAFLVIGFRGGKWMPGLFLGVPIILCFFSYLYAFSALVGLVTRSTIASLLITVAFWCVIGLVHLTETGFLTAKNYRDLEVAAERANADLKRPAPAPPDAEVAAKRQADSDKAQASLDKALEAQSFWTRMHTAAFVAKTLLPKTSETVKLMERRLLSSTDMEMFEENSSANNPHPRGDRATRNRLERAGRESERIQRERSAAWVIGTSLGFEAVVLALAGWIFWRRDF